MKTSRSSGGILKQEQGLGCPFWSKKQALSTLDKACSCTTPSGLIWPLATKRLKKCTEGSHKCVNLFQDLTDCAYGGPDYTDFHT
jgi:hypothetical protein